MPQNPSGRIELICGPMFAGKTTALIERLNAARDAGCRVVAIKPKRDTRSGEATLRTHTGATLGAIPVRDAQEIPVVVADADVVGIDEAHFFARELTGVCERAAQDGRRVIAAGVFLDHRGEPFETLAALRGCANEVTEMTAPCKRCGAPGMHTQRLIASDAPIVVGGVEAYEPRCAACFEQPPSSSS